MRLKVHMNLLVQECQWYHYEIDIRIASLMASRDVIFFVYNYTKTIKTKEMIKLEDRTEEIFKLLKKWYKYPKYQLERRIDIFFTLYLPEILKKEGINVELDDIFPEFPLKKENNQSTNADYAVFENKENEVKLYLIELKTEMNSISDSQIKYYKNVQGKKLTEVLEKIIQIQESKNCKQWYKYDKLLEDIENRYNFITSNFQSEKKRKKWIKNENKLTVAGNVEIIYLVPNDSQDKLLKEANEFKVIYFEDIIKIIEKKYKDKLSKEFCNLLKELSSS